MLDTKFTYQRLADRLRENLRQGEYQVGDRLPTVEQLAGQYNVNKNTVLRSIKALVNEQVLESRRGCGITIRSIPKEVVIKTRSILTIIPLSLSHIKFHIQYRTESSAIAEVLPGWQLFETFIDDTKDEKELYPFLDNFINSHKHDLYLLASVSESMKRYFKKKGIPCVVAGDLPEGIDLPNVTIDEYGRFYSGTKYLLACGYKNIAFIQFANRTPGDYKREAGVLEAYNEHVRAGEVRRPHIILADPFKIDEVEQNLRRFLAEATFPLGIICCTDFISCRILQIANSLNINIPDQLGLITAGSSEFPQNTTPTMTSLFYDPIKVGFVTGRFIRSIIDGYPLEERHVIVSFDQDRIIKRETTP